MNRVNISHIQLYAFTGGTKGGDHQIKKQNKKKAKTQNKQTKKMKTVKQQERSTFLFALVREWQQDYVLYMENQL